MLGTLETIWVIQGFTGTPNRHLGVLVFIFINDGKCFQVVDVCWQVEDL